MKKWHPLSRILSIGASFAIGAILWHDFSTEQTGGAGAFSVVTPAPIARSTAVQPAATVIEEPVMALAEITAFDAMIEQPLFSPARRAAPVAGSVDIPAEPFEPVDSPAISNAYADGIELVGTLIHEGRRQALVTRAGERRIERVAEGDTLEGWEVVAITDTTLEVRSQDGQVQKRLAFPRLGKAGTPASGNRAG